MLEIPESIWLQIILTFSFIWNTWHLRCVGDSIFAYICGSLQVASFDIGFWTYLYRIYYSAQLFPFGKNIKEGRKESVEKQDNDQNVKGDEYHLNCNYGDDENWRKMHYDDSNDFHLQQLLRWFLIERVYRGSSSILLANFFRHPVCVFQMETFHTLLCILVIAFEPAIVCWGRAIETLVIFDWKRYPSKWIGSACHWHHSPNIYSDNHP